MKIGAEDIFASPSCSHLVFLLYFALHSRRYLCCECESERRYAKQMIWALLVHKQGVAKRTKFSNFLVVVYSLFWPVNRSVNQLYNNQKIAELVTFCHPLVARRCDRIAASLCRDVDDSFSVFRRWFFDLFTIDSTAAADGASGVTNTLDAMASSALLTEWWHGVHEP